MSHGNGQSRYGAMFRIPEALGRTTIIVCDPKAIQHFYSKETYGYIHDPLGKALIADIVRLSLGHCQIKARKLKCMIGRKGRTFG